MLSLKESLSDGSPGSFQSFLCSLRPVSIETPVDADPRHERAIVWILMLAVHVEEDVNVPVRCRPIWRPMTAFRRRRTCGARPMASWPQLIPATMLPLYNFNLMLLRGIFKVASFLVFLDALIRLPLSVWIRLSLPAVQSTPRSLITSCTLGPSLGSCCWRSLLASLFDAMKPVLWAEILRLSASRSCRMYS